MSLSQFLSPCRQLRSIISELRQALQLPERTQLGQTQSMKFIMSQYRRNAVTQEQVCRHKEEMAFMADTYNTYLRSQREWYALQQEYHAKGERTVPEAAKMVGFNLPHEDKIERKAKPKTD